MILLYLIAAALGAIAYMRAARLGRRARVVIAMLAFLVPAIGITASFAIIGDRAPPDAVTVHLN